MNFCGNCGAPLRDQARFCNKCGAVVPIPAEDAAFRQPSAAPQPGATSQAGAIRPVPSSSSERRVPFGLTRGNFIFFSALAGALFLASVSGLLAYFTALPGASMHDEMNPAGIAFSAACGPAYGGAAFGLVTGAGLGWLLTLRGARS